jgi:heme-degrading monooxygenase HmoA
MPHPPSLSSGIDPLGEDDPFGNYVSFTIWAEKKHFNAWRGGEAFKEAHGGTSLFAFVSTMVGSAMVLKGAPRPAFYDGLLHQSVVPETVPETVDGWRNVNADGSTILPAECFVACNQFFVPPDNAMQFESRWRDRTSRLAGCDGFVSFDLLRRDVKAKGHGIAPMGDEEPSYMTCTIWRDRAAFEGWRTGSAFKEAHGSGSAGEVKGGEQPQKPPAPLWSRPPVPVFYEGTLVISSPEGA